MHRIWAPALLQRITAFKNVKCGKSITQSMHSFSVSEAIASVEDLQKAIQEFLDAWNQNPKTFCLDSYAGIDPGKAVSLSAKRWKRLAL